MLTTTPLDLVKTGIESIAKNNPGNFNFSFGRYCRHFFDCGRNRDNEYNDCRCDRKNQGDWFAQGGRRHVKSKPFLQFLTEAVILACLGGLAGIILGSLATQAINKFFPAEVTVNSVILAFGVSSLVGILFGIAPARRASKQSPIEALRYE